MGCQGGSPAEGAPLFRDPRNLRRRSFTRGFPSITSTMFLALERIATALPHDERSRDKLARTDAMSVIGARAENICS
jgi:hypothetical protein